MTAPGQIKTKHLEAAFTEWDRRYREAPDSFMSDVQHLLGNTTYSYGRACAAYLKHLLKEQE